jgi:hypothetical protein
MMMPLQPDYSAWCIFLSNRAAKIASQASPKLSETRSKKPAGPSCMLAIAKATKKTTIKMTVRTE